MKTAKTNLPAPSSPAFEVSLDDRHPGLHDLEYRHRRDEIARLARLHVHGEEPRAVQYSSDEEATWKAVWSHLRPELKKHACSDVWSRMQSWAPWERGIPQLTQLSAPGGPLLGTGFSFEPVEGLLSSIDFFESLRRGVFRSTQYLRHPSRPLYTPEPDLVHELVGHAATFSIPGVAELSLAFGEAAQGADAEALLRLERLYWYTVEFGVVSETGTPKAFGAGLLSSAGELAGMLDADLRPFSTHDIQERSYETTRTQSVLFVADSLTEMLEGTIRAVEAVQRA